VKCITLVGVFEKEIINGIFHFQANIFQSEYMNLLFKTV